MSMDRKVRAGLASLLRRVPGIGVVHEYERFTKNERQFQELYVRDGQLLGWHLRRGTVKETIFDTQVFRVRTRWHIRGLAALVDSKASELAFDALVDQVRRTFRRFPELKNEEGRGYARTLTDEGAGVAVDESGPVMFAGALCHSVKLSLVTEHFEEIEPKLSEGAEVAGYDEEGNPVEPGQPGEPGEPGQPCPDGPFTFSLAIFPGDPEWRLVNEEKDNGENSSG